MREVPVIAALDLETPEEALQVASGLEGVLTHVKVGPRLFAMGGTALVEALSSRFEVFLDLKLCDIPNTVAMAVEALSRMGIWALTLHACGGRRMLQEARSASGGRTKLLGVTVLTSLDEGSFEEVCPGAKLGSTIRRRMELCAEAHLDGLVCSPLDLKLLPPACSGMIKVTPGVRAPGEADDQARRATPFEAFSAGSDFLVIGRPLLRAEDKRALVERILEDFEEARSHGEGRV